MAERGGLRLTDLGVAVQLLLEDRDALYACNHLYWRLHDRIAGDENCAEESPCSLEFATFAKLESAKMVVRHLQCGKHDLTCYLLTQVGEKAYEFVHRLSGAVNSKVASISRKDIP